MGTVSTALKILIVEDDLTSIMTLMDILGSKGMDLSIAGSYSEAMIRLKSMPTHVLLDLGLPEGSGLGVLEYIRENQLPVKVAVITGMRDQRVLDQVAALKPDILLRKPYALTDLISWIRSDE